MIANEYTTVRDYALRYLWANPHEDKQTLFKTNRLSKVNGCVNYLNVGSIVKLTMPVLNIRFHVFELGLLDSVRIGLNLNLNVWTPYDKFIDVNNVLIFAFIQGRMANLENAYVQLRDNGNLIFVLDYAKNSYLNGLTQELYIRFYSNIYFTDTSVSAHLFTGRYEHSNITQTNYFNFKTLLDSKIANYGLNPFIFLNGLYLPDGLPTFNQLNNSDNIQYVFDPTLKTKTDLDVLNAPFFNSSLDNCRKVIASIDVINDSVFTDDIEFFISGVKTNGLRVGVYFARLHPSYVRMLTFKDWALHSEQLTLRQDDLINFADTVNLSNFQIHIVRRDNGQVRDKTLDTNRMLDLMNLPLTVRIQALTGVNSNFTLWQANSLERSDPNLWIAKEYPDIVTSSFNNVVSRFTAMTILERVKRVTPNSDFLLPPTVSNSGGKLLKYDVDGFNPNFTTYAAVSNVNVSYTDGKGYELFIPGFEFNSPLDTVLPIGQSSIEINDTFDIFCYYKNSNDELVYAIPQVDYNLNDINGLTVIAFNSNLINFEKYIRTSNRGVQFTSSITLNDVIEGINVYNNQTFQHDVGMETLLVWINGRYQIEGLDYTLYKGKLYFVANNDYFTFPAILTVLYLGLPDISLRHINKTDWGFVEYGSILNNNLYDLLMYRNKLFFIQGKAITVETIHDQEHYVDKTTVSELSYTDGQPFAIVPMLSFSRSDRLNSFCPTSLMDKEVDINVIEYLNALDPQIEKGTFITIPTRYTVVSLLINKLIEDILSGTLLTPPVIYNELVIYEMITAYLDLLNVDPTRFNLEDKFVEIVPKWTTEKVTVSINAYNFLDSVNKYYLNNKVSGLNIYLSVA